MRLATTYARRMEEKCNCEWAQGEAWDKKNSQLEKSIEQIAKRLPGVKGVKFTGDPRGYTVRLVLECGRGNTWSGDEDGWGIA